MSASKNLIQAASGVGGGDFYPYTIENSCRFDLSSYLYRTGTSTSSTWTLSFWIKRTAVSYSNYQYIFTSGTNGLSIGGTSAGTDVDQFYIYNGSVTYMPQKYRDPSAWQHWVVSCNAGTATVYVNNTTVGSSIGAFSLQTTTNGTIVGRYSNGSYFLGAYLAEVALVDGSALTPSSFAEDKNGVWIPKNISGLTFGTDGFYLDFSNSGALGTDVSGNGNNFTSSGLTSADQMSDTPTHNNVTWLSTYESGGSNYKSSGTLSNGNLTASVNTNQQIGIASSVLPSTGKWYWEIEVDSVAAMGIGMTNTRYLNAISSNQTLHYNSGGSGNSVYIEGSIVTPYGTSWTTGDVIGVYFNADDGEISWYKNGTAMDASPYSLSYSDGWIPYIAQLSGGGTCVGTLVTDENKFNHTPPTDALSLSTANLPEPTIGPNSARTSDENFYVGLYTGTGAELAITQVPFSPDKVDIKDRDIGHSWMVFDRLRGATNFLYYDTASVEQTNAQSLKSFDANGFTLGTHSPVNTSGDDYVFYCYKGNGSGVSNTDGSITSTVSVNQDAGISFISYTNNNTASQSIGHGLGVTPKVIITKRLTGSGWGFFGPILGVDKYMYLDTSDAVATASGYMPAPSSTVVNTGNPIWSALNSGTGDSLLYCFAEVEGFSSFGSYTGNGSTDGPFIYTGFRPAYLVIKSSSGTSQWYVHDSARTPYNLNTNTLFLDLANAESTAELESTYGKDMLSNGFKIRASHGTHNASGATYIYMAFAENPFKYSNAR